MTAAALKKPLAVLAVALCMALALSLTPALAGAEPMVIKITAKKFEFSPSEITLKKGVPVVLELVSLDRTHGFNCPDLGVRADVAPGKPTRVNLTPGKAGSFVFNCDIFCGDGHEDMTGTIVVKE
jgi:cytochrome c oxidase subunit 2